MRDNKKNKKLKILLIISVILTIFLIYSTYARYFEELNTNYDINIKKWNLKINNIEIQTNKELTQLLQPNFIHNENMSDGIIVPGREGYFQVDLDYSQVDLPFDFKFEYKQNGINNLIDLEIFKYTIENSIEKEKEELTKEVIIPIDPNNKNDFEKKKIIKVYFRWNDNNLNKMDNYQDTIFEGENDENGGKNKMLKYMVALSFEQHK